MCAARVASTYVYPLRRRRTAFQWRFYLFFPQYIERVECLENTRLLRLIWWQICFDGGIRRIGRRRCSGCVRMNELLSSTIYVRTQSSPNNLLTKPRTLQSAEQKQRKPDKLLAFCQESLSTRLKFPSDGSWHVSLISHLLLNCWTPLWKQLLLIRLSLSWR